MKALLQAVVDLHEAELYDDLKFYFAFHFEEHLLDNELKEAEQALLFKLIADAYYQTDCFFQSIKYYERALEIIKHLPRNSYPKSICQAELRFLLHKAYLRERKFEEAIRVLNLIPKNDHTPKSRAALAKLLTSRLSRQSKSDIVACHNHVLSQFPSTATYTQNELLKLGVKRTPKEDETETEAAYFKARHLLNQQKPLDAIDSLKKCKKTNPLILLELATLYNSVGHRRKAINELERLRLVDPHGVKGMDLLASLYYANQLTNKSSGELESLVRFLNDAHPNQPETFLALAYLSKQHNNPKEAQLFAQRALILAHPGKEKAHAALLRALILIENRNYEAADHFLQNILKFDNQNIDAFELNLRANLQRKNYETAKMTGLACRKSIGVDNPRACLIYAQSIEMSSKEECEQCLKVLVDRYPYLTDAVVFLAKFLEQRAKYTEAVSILEKAAESNLNPIIQEILVDLNSKCKKIDETLNIRPTTNQNESIDSFVLHSSLNSSFGSFSTTPNCANGVPNNRPVHGAPRRQRTNAVRHPPGIDLPQQLEFDDSDALETMRRDLFAATPHNSIFQTPNAYIDEDINVG